MKLVQHPSPNWNHRPCAVDAIILHATADRDTAVSVAWCCATKAQNPNPVSYHVIVDRDGTVYALVPTDKRAWHAGVSRFDGRDGCNDFAIGLSFANANDGAEPYREEQIAVGAALVAEWMKKYPAVTLERITTHAAVALPPGRKTDPAPPAFDVDAFRQRVTEELTR